MDETSDTAVVAVPGFRPKGLGLAHSNPEIGTSCWAIGNPLAYFGSITEGIVSSYHEEHGLVASTHIAPGSSGCPLVNAKGQVIGIASALMIQYNSLNFFVPISKLNKFLDRV